MFCQAVIGRLAGGAGGARDDQIEALRRAAATAAAAVAPPQLRALLAPLPLEHDRQAVDDDVQEAADEQPEHQAGADEDARRGGQQLDHGHDCLA